MTYTYTQIAHYFRCPRSYRHRYLDGWREKETRAAMIFGRCFEKALESYFCGDDCGAALYREWGVFRDTPFAYKKEETWDRLVHQGVHLLERFAQDNRIHIPQPQQNLQIKVVRELPNANQFIAYVDAVGELDGLRCLMDWKTTTSRYFEEPAGLPSLDPQLICYSWIMGIPEVALVVFVRKHPKTHLLYLCQGCSEGIFLAYRATEGKSLREYLVNPQENVHDVHDVHKLGRSHRSRPRYLATQADNKVRLEKHHRLPCSTLLRPTEILHQQFLAG